ncbi:hypothetical protein KEF85_07035 [Methylomonas paludis]|uniref:Methanethiol oxidase n=1 Tax=Methylomonas paludis TaxID=1173101 RepID=A0A975RAI8_9GAMM|nr:selenium-binding family protein [Methylomonas paludis]QWF72197.1 hypothetical protein KEF85_07035 [Methylomonas paludis]
MKIESNAAVRKTGLMVGAVLLLGYGQTSQAVKPPPPLPTEDTLLVWAGDKLHKAPDFLSVIDLNASSATYGKVLRTVPLPSAVLPTSANAPWANLTDKNGNLYGGAIGNEPHHVGLSADKKTFVGGGLLSVLNGQNQSFFFDVTNPRQPSFISAEGAQVDGSLTYASIADEYEPVSNGHFLATFMGSWDGNAPGRLIEYDTHHHVVGVWPDKLDANIPAGFNPHGISFDESRNLLVTSDFICPIHTILGHSHDGGNSDLFRGSVRYWNFDTRQIKQTIPVGDGKAGTIAVELIPRDSKERAFASGVIDGKLYLIDPNADSGKGSATPVFDFNTHPGFVEADGTPPWPHLIRINKIGTRLFITLNYQGQHGRVAQFNIENPTAPKLLGVVNLGVGSGPHFLELSNDEKRLVVSDYFLDENLGVDAAPIGIVGVEGDHKVHVLNVTPNNLQLDSKFKLDFSSDIVNIPGYGGAYPVNGRPHGFALINSKK